MQRLKSDPAFAAQVIAIADPAQRLVFLATEGYVLNPGDLDAYNQRLGEASLDTIAGGGNMPAFEEKKFCHP
jgi:predicted ribosomally synthesized peptide with nif11-like leader